MITESDSATIGQMCCLMTADNYYGGFVLRDLRRLIIPPVTLKQFLLFKHRNEAVGFLTYGMVSEDVERDVLLADQRFQPEHWRSGNRAWIIDCVIAAGSPRLLQPKLFAAFRDFSEVKYLRRDKMQKIKSVNRYVNSGQSFKRIPWIERNDFT
ncbi:toxin-activating lysine-acyltransferase [Roseobacter sp.]|uniref:toxin-activating lysine-acyltransferase n=1 Tax=Roseobacter sp. TaxID=1907202 RepID=UPI002968B587|nr:toxin-activating lysine-acyltransferase [Roseobacter sp.]